MSVLVIDKPSGPTSFEIVRRVRRALLLRLGAREEEVVARGRSEALPRGARRGGARGPSQGPRLKVGHGGTLDPLASGVLPVCVGEGTKLGPFLLDADKEYEATVRFGVETDTLDADGKVVAARPTDALTEGALREALPRFLGAIDQVPPMYSALKRAGRPLYSYARAGEEVERQPRRVQVHALELLAWTPPDSAQLRVRCSKGTYVRVLAADLGRTLGVGAHLGALRRTMSGPFHLGQALSLEAFEARAAAGEALPFVPLADALVHLAEAVATEVAAVSLVQGKRVPLEAVGLAPGTQGLIRVLRPDRTLLAVADAGEGTLHARRIFREADWEKT
jgi:tRNA pseudouridine55 synthase